MAETTYPDNPLLYLNLHNGETLRIAELHPTPDNQNDMTPYADGVAATLRESWGHKFVKPGVLLPHEPATVLKNEYQQRKAIGETWSDNEAARQLGRPSRAARYFVTSATGYAPPTKASDIRAFLRVEPYKPKWPRFSNPHRQPYPNITDIETRNGKLAEGEYHLDALGLMYTALYKAHPGHKVAAYTERENPDGIKFLESLSFHDRDRDQVVAVGSRPDPDGQAAHNVSLHYAHMEAQHALSVMDHLRVLVRPYIDG